LLGKQQGTGQITEDAVCYSVPFKLILDFIWYIDRILFKQSHFSTPVLFDWLR